MELLKMYMQSEASNGLVRFILGANFDTFYKSIVVLANPETVLNARFAKKETKEKIIRADQLINHIKALEKNCHELSSSDKEMKRIAERFMQWNKENPEDYLSKYDKYKEPQADNPGVCPKCGAKLVLRTATKGEWKGKKFYGCSAFPKCRYIWNID